ncbi:MULTISPECIES: hypothetical protein [Pseudovibrio]|nr:MULTISPECIES: hypothetical protein [Pseudovibrio]MDD7909789.1 hypothetical protein [Pseudovibrio exalbescens]MDX5592129.1 hypothetical protein [Pseudovibrio sp. SPO723]
MSTNPAELIMIFPVFMSLALAASAVITAPRYFALEATQHRDHPTVRPKP